MIWKKQSLKNVGIFIERKRKKKRKENCQQSLWQVFKTKFRAKEKTKFFVQFAVGAKHRR